MYRAFAPFFKTIRGDRRVTGMAQRERGRLGGITGSADISAAFYC